MPRASVIVRAKDAAGTIERALSGLRAQTVPLEIVVVDSGSTDATIEIARRYCDRLIEIPAGQFSFGGALNVGARAADAPCHVALSAHCAPNDTALGGTFAGPLPATGGSRHQWLPAPGPRGQTGVVLQDSGSFAPTRTGATRTPPAPGERHVWKRFPFDEQLEAAEDREWSWRVLEAGHVIAMDPALEVLSDHRRSAGLRHLYSRYRKEAQAISGFAADRPYAIRDAVRDWWQAPRTSGRSAARVRSSPWHIAATLGRYAGERSAWQRRQN